MIISRTPFRVSFIGGGSDFRDFYRNHGYGAVLSAAIQRYMYIVIHPYFQDNIRIKYSQTEDVQSVEEIKHPIVRECLKRVGVATGIEIASFADVAAGTGLGSSSAFTVGLLHALYAYRGRIVPKQQLAAEACEIEIDILGEPIGKQDQYAVACGGFNLIRFNRDESVDVQPILLTTEQVQSLEKSLRLYYLGGQRQARDILQQQQQLLKTGSDTGDIIKKMLNLADELKGCLDQGDISAVGRILDEGWQLKQQMAPNISNYEINSFYAAAKDAGAEGGKLLGAGGTGFLLLSHLDQDRLEEQLGGRTLPFKIDREGSKIIFYE